MLEMDKCVNFDKLYNVWGTKENIADLIFNSGY